MTTPAFLGKRCSHGFMPGLCESVNCVHLRAPRRRDQSLKRVEPPRCSYCKQQRKDAVLRERAKDSVRLCDDCNGDRLKRIAELARRAALNRPRRDYAAERSRPLDRQEE